MEISYSSFKKHVREHRYVYGIGSAVLLIVLMKSPTSKNSSENQAPRSKASYSLSESAEKVAELLDRGAYTSADRLFDVYLNQYPSDAGLLCQYVRFLILSYDPQGVNYITSPILPGDSYLPVSVFSKAFTMAGEFDPECKSYLADVTFRAMSECFRREEVQKGLISISTGLWTTDDFAHTMILCGWDALKADPKIGKKWAPEFSALARRFAELGKVSSAMMLGNLAGDLMQGGKGAEDFRQANAMLLEALRHDSELTNPSTPEEKKIAADSMKAIVNKYPICFGEELRGELGPVDEVDPRFQELQKEFRKRCGVGVGDKIEKENNLF
jgi:hypothetical protein